MDTFGNVQCSFKLISFVYYKKTLQSIAGQLATLEQNTATIPWPEHFLSLYRLLHRIVWLHWHVKKVEDAAEQILI